MSTKVEWLQTPKTVFLPDQFRLNEGVLEGDTEEDDHWKPLSFQPKISEKLAHGCYEGTFIFGTPALKVAETKVDTSALEQENHYIRGDATSGVPIFVRSGGYLKGNVLICTVDVFEKGKEWKKLSSFSFREGLFDQDFTTVHSIDSRLITLSLYTRKHRKVNSIIFYDLVLKRAVGYLEYGEIHYFPKEKSIWNTDFTITVENMDETMQDLREEAEIHPIYIKGKINSYFGRAVEQYIQQDPPKQRKNH